MINRTVVAVLRILLIGALAATIILQVIGLPWLSGVMAQDYPRRGVYAVADTGVGHFGSWVRRGWDHLHVASDQLHPA